MTKALVAGEPVARLIERAQGGDREAFDALLAEARPRALAVALKVLRNPDDAEDAVQDAFVKVWRHLGRFERRASFSTWLHRIVMNASLDLLRRSNSRPDLRSEEEAPERAASPEIVGEETPERHVDRLETASRVRGAMATLTPRHREALTLRELEDKSYQEIAQASGCPVGTVMSRLHHARRKLAAELRPEVEAGLRAA